MKRAISASLNVHLVLFFLHVGVFLSYLLRIFAVSGRNLLGI